MRLPAHRIGPRDGVRRGDGPRDAGMSMVEVMVALLLFALMSTAVLGMVVTMERMTRQESRRAAASNLALRELEIVRDTFTSVTRGPDRVGAQTLTDPDPLPTGTAGRPLVVDGIGYTVVRTTEWASVDSAAASTCDEGTTSELAYLKVDVKVTWPDMGGTQPVHMDTVMTPPKGTYSTQSGHIGVKILDRNGAGEQGMSVTAVSGGTTRTATTDVDGCALISFVAPGTYTVSVSKPGYVTQQGATTGSLTATVTAGQIWKGSIPYDRAATLNVSFVTDDGFTVPALTNIPVTLANSGLLPKGSAPYAGTGNTRTITNLWPYASGYQSWIGNCLDNDPQSNSSGDPRDLPASSEPGGTASVAISLGALKLTGAASATYVATQKSDSSCASGASITLGSTNAQGLLSTALPYGTWTIGRSGTSSTVSATLVNGAAPLAVTAP